MSVKIYVCMFGEVLFHSKLVGCYCSPALVYLKYKVTIL